jgi:hypothetical protein
VRAHCECLERVANLISRQALQESVREMADAEQRVFLQKGLVDSESECTNCRRTSDLAESVLGLKNISRDVLNMGPMFISTANGVGEMRARLETALGTLRSPWSEA